MKKIIILFLLSCIFYSCISRSSQREIRKYQTYIGTPISYYLECEKGYTEVLIKDSKPGLATSMIVIYSDSVEVEFIPKRFKYMKPFDVNRKWNIEDFKKERIEAIRFLKNGIITGVIPDDEKLKKNSD